VGFSGFAETALTNDAEKELAAFFEETFHGYWTNVTISFLSDPMDK
jgi:hypothetical protein